MEAGAPPRGWRCGVLWLVSVEIVLVLVCTRGAGADSGESKGSFLQDSEAGEKDVYLSHSCIHDEILHQRRRAGRKEYSVMPQVYHESREDAERVRGRHLLGMSSWRAPHENARKPIRIYLNYDAVGHSPDRDCKNVGDIVKLGEPPVSSAPGTPICDPHGDPPLVGDCWYNCTLEDIAGKDKRQRLRKALGQTVEWFRKALAVEPVKGNLRLSGYSACGQDGGVQLPHAYVEDGVANADLVLLVTTRPTTGNTLAWAVACERDQWGRAIAGHVNVAPRHLTAEAETLLSATLIHEVMHVLGFDPHAFTHFRDERKRRRGQVTAQSLDKKLGRMVTRVVLPRVVMHARHHYGAFSQNFTGLELEDGGGRGTSGSHWEKRLLMNEIMTGSVDTRSVVSRMTLALLEDSGWYQANYSMAEHLDWGQNQGTEFVISPCNSWKGAYHCNTTQLSGCTYNREAEGYCPIVNYSGDLPKWAQYFPQANKGGQSSLADYCTYYVAYSDGSCTDVNSARAPDRMLGEVRGSNSRSLFCSEGELICPMYHELCTTVPVPMIGQCPKSCSFNGDCIDGTCHCFPGFHGHDCSRRSCPDKCSNHGTCKANGICECQSGWTGIDCSTAVCDEQCSLHGGVCDNGKCEFRCSDYAGYTCQKGSAILPSLSMCHDVLVRDSDGQHCAPSELSILQQLETVVLVPNYNRLMPSGRTFLNFFNNANCAAAAKRLACWVLLSLTFSLLTFLSCFLLSQFNGVTRMGTTGSGYATLHANCTIQLVERVWIVQTRPFLAKGKKKRRVFRAQDMARRSLSGYNISEASSVMALDTGSKRPFHLGTRRWAALVYKLCWSGLFVRRLV
ncbi:metalloendopeptidase [Zea mays]|uniref:Metalloendopeptidase n=1 Tax=Zea mays TaxID=4577 RepID=A0A1D6L354_MAIZE|nr:metalloendopeptidase [Zea mays]